jgi:transposase
MTEQDTELKRRLVVGHKRDGRSRYDPQAKRELIERAMRGDVSVARLALDHGINANLLRNWIRLHQRQAEGGQPTAVALQPAFIPVVPAVAATDAGASLVARLPNGVRLELGQVGGETLATILRQLWALPCSDSTRA